MKYVYKVWRDCGYDVNSAVVCGRFGYELKKDAHSTSASVTHGGCTVKLNTRSVMSLAPPSPVTAATPHVALPTNTLYKVDVKKLYRRRGEIVVMVWLQWRSARKIRPSDPRTRLCIHSFCKTACIRAFRRSWESGRWGSTVHRFDCSLSLAFVVAYVTSPDLSLDHCYRDVFRIRPIISSIRHNLNGRAPC